MAKVFHEIGLLSDQQRDAWLNGEIDDVGFDAATSMLSYRLASQPDSRISFYVPPERVQRWKARHEMVS